MFDCKNVSDAISTGTDAMGGRADGDSEKKRATRLGSPVSSRPRQNGLPILLLNDDVIHTAFVGLDRQAPPIKVVPRRYRDYRLIDVSGDKRHRHL
jgi:hypothetical protein